MSITPTVLIAAQGMLSGQGVGVSADMTAKMSAATSDPIAGGVTQLQAQATALAGTDAPSAAAITAALNSLPSAFTAVSTAATNAASQAAKMVPDIKSFITLHSSSTAFGSASAEYGAALAQFGSKSFGDLGIGVKSFVDANSGGLTSLLPGMGALAAKAKSDAFGGLATGLDPTALLKGQASMASNALSDGLKSVGKGIENFGSLFDFKNPQQLGYQSLVKSLQNQGLADSVGINDAISAAGYDPKNLAAVPDSVLQTALSTVQGSDLQKIISQVGVKPSGIITSVADLADPTKIMPAGAAAALGLKPGAGLEGLKSLGNTFTNIGVPMDGASAAKLLGGVQTKVGSYLSGLTELVPKSVSASLGPFLGTGSSPFGTPSMSDMMGSVSGKHSDDFTAAGTQLASISSSSQGQAVANAMKAVVAAITAGSGLPAALSQLSSASSAFASSALSNADLKKALGSVSDSMASVTNHLSLENTNLGLAGMSLNSLPAVVPGSGQILAFASKLHSFGVDKLQLGHNDVMNGVAADGLTGDAIKAALLEGKNVAAMASAGKTPPSVSNPAAALAEANSNNFDSFIQAFEAAKSAEKSAKEAMDASEAKATSLPPTLKPTDPEFVAALSDFQSKMKAHTAAIDKSDDARNKMMAAASTPKDNNRAGEVIAKYIG